MHGIAFLVPTYGLLELADQIRQKHPNIIQCKKLTNEQVEKEAEEAVQEGASVIVARGTQAERIRHVVNVPVVEIVWTAQEIGLAILEAKKILKAPCQTIGITGLKSMFCDTSHFSVLFGVKIKTYYYLSEKDKERTIEDLEDAKADVLIGSQDILLMLHHINIPTIPIISTEESVRLAAEQAETVFYANELEQKNKAQVNSLLDSVFNGMIQIDDTACVVMVNRVMEGILNKGQGEILGCQIRDVIQELNMDLVSQVLQSPRESFSTFLNINGKAMVMILSPIVVDDKITGAYLSLKKITKNDELHYMHPDEARKGDLRAYRTFHSIPYKSEKMGKLIEQAKLYAQSNTPLMIEAQSGDDREGICQGIHNYSLRKNGPYVAVSMVGLSEEKQMELLFGSGGERRNSQRVVGALEKANGGTIVITGIGFATTATQSALCRFIRENSGVQVGNGDIKFLDVRIIITSSESLLLMRKKNIVTFTFYYIFSGLVLRIPPLQERREDIENFVNLYLKKYTQQYDRYQVMTPEAMEYLKDYEWLGSGLQIERFIERMVLTIEKRTIKKHLVEALLQEMYPDEIMGGDTEERYLDTEDPYEKLLRETLLKHSGNRSATAKELGISLTTLWRKMKKYKITE